jgi:hypothetical protein
MSVALGAAHLHHDFFYTATQHGGFTVERG